MAEKNEVQVQQNGVSEKRVPILSGYDGDYQVSVWANRRRIKIVVSRRVEGGWERLAQVAFPLDYTIYKIAFEVEGGLDVLKRVVRQIVDLGKD